MRTLLFAAVALFPVLLAGQTNLEFTSGLTGWTVPVSASGAGYSAESRHHGCRSSVCAVLLSSEEPPAGSMGNLQQSFDAAAYRGKAIRFRAWLRVEGSDPAERGQLWMRVELSGGRLGFFDTMGDRPVRSRQWQSCEISGEVSQDAQSISLGILSRGKGKVWIDSMSLEAAPLDTSSRVLADRAAITALYARIDAAYGTGDVDALASFALPDARILLDGKGLPLEEALAPIMDEIRKGTRFRSDTTVTAIGIAGDAATVFVNNLVTRTNGAATEKLASTDRDTWIRTAAGWRLKESALVDTHEAK